MTTQTFDAIVVGNGAIGSSLAVELADRGLTVALIGPENRQYAASTAAGAMLGCFGEVTADLISDDPGRTKFALDLKAKELWPDWVEKISDHSPLDGTDLFTASGTTVILNTVGTREIDTENFSAIQKTLQENNEPFDTVDVDDIGWVDADPNSRPLEAIHIPGEHAVDSGRLLARLEGAAAARGCTLIHERAVSLREDHGRIRAVVLDNGDVIEAGQVVLAAGVGSQARRRRLPVHADTGVDRHAQPLAHARPGLGKPARPPLAGLWRDYQPLGRRPRLRSTRDTRSRPRRRRYRPAVPQQRRASRRQPVLVRVHAVRDFG